MDRNKGIKPDYIERINRVLSYIENNLGEQFKLTQLSELGNFSQFHFHRIVKAYLNEPIGAYIKRKRLEKAAQLLQFSNRSITDIAYSVGYETASSFSDSFSKRFGMSPSSFRNNYNNTKDKIAMDIPEKINFDFQPVIESRPAIKVAYVRQWGSYGEADITKAWNTLFEFAGRNGLLGSSTKLYGISYDNPTVSEENKCQYNACISIDREMKPEGNIGIKEIEGGKYAVFTYKGDYDNFPLVYDLIFHEWLLKSDFELRNTEVYDQYLNSPFDVEKHELLTKICLPIK